MKQIDIHFYFINFFSLVFYFLILWNLDIGITDVTFFSEDARSYWDVSLWLMGGDQNIHIVRRPIIYPIILLAFKGIAGDKGIWFIHLIFWLFIVNLTFRSVYILTKNYILSYVGIILIVLNLSLIAFTLHALAEVTLIFMISVLVYFYVKNIENKKELSFIHGCILILSLLTIIKPVFLIPSIIVSFIIVPLYYRKNYMKKPKKLWMLILVLSPIIMQVSIIKYTSGKFAVSEIGAQTFTNYILAEGIQNHEKIDRFAAIDKAQKFTSSEKIIYLFENRKSYFFLFIGNLKGNLKGFPSFLTFPKESEHIIFRDFMIRYNQVLYIFHLIFLLFILFFITKTRKRKAYKDFLKLAVMYTLALYLFLVSGISYWQGDRLLLPILPIWISIYLKIMNDIYYWWRREKS